MVAANVLAKTMDENQRDHVNLRFGMFLHFNMGTFHDAEWVNPGQDPLCCVFYFKNIVWLCELLTKSYGYSLFKIHDIMEMIKKARFGLRETNTDSLFFFSSNGQTLHNITNTYFKEV